MIVHYNHRQAFLARKHYFNDKESGVLVTKKRTVAAPNPMSGVGLSAVFSFSSLSCTDPSMMQDMMKGQMVGMVPMIVMGGLINWVFSGFLTSQS